jgi:hypothetical protein
MREIDPPQLSAVAPSGPVVTAYDRAHLMTYIELLRATERDTDWRETSRTIIGIDPDAELNRARSAFVTHLARAKWLVSQGKLFPHFGSA